MIEIAYALKKHNKHYFHWDYKNAYKHLLPDISFGPTWTELVYNPNSVSQTLHGDSRNWAGCCVPPRV